MIVVGLFLMPMIFFALGLMCLYAGQSHQAAGLFKLSGVGYLLVLGFGYWGWRRRRSGPSD